MYRIYGVTVGTSPAAVLSCIWAYIEVNGPPREIILFPSPKARPVAETVRKAVEKAWPEVGRCSIVEIPEYDVERAAEIIYGVFRERRRLGSIHVDVTPGRKSMSIAVYKAALDAGAEKVFYLHLRDDEFKETLYPLIPVGARKLVRLR